MKLSINIIFETIRCIICKSCSSIVATSQQIPEKWLTPLSFLLIPLACIYSTSYCLHQLKAWRLIPLPPNSAPPDQSIISVDEADTADSADILDASADTADTPDYDSVNLTLYAASASRTPSKEGETSRSGSPVLSYKVMMRC